MNQLTHSAHRNNKKKSPFASKGNSVLPWISWFTVPHHVCLFASTFFFFLLATCYSVHTAAFFIFIFLFFPPHFVCLFVFLNAMAPVIQWPLNSSHSVSLSQSHFSSGAEALRISFKRILTTHFFFFFFFFSTDALKSGWFSCNIPEQNQRHGSGFLISWMKFCLKISFSPVLLVCVSALPQPALQRAALGASSPLSLLLSYFGAEGHELNEGVEKGFKPALIGHTLLHHFLLARVFRSLLYTVSFFFTV